MIQSQVVRQFFVMYTIHFEEAGGQRAVALIIIIYKKVYFSISVIRTPQSGSSFDSVIDILCSKRFYPMQLLIFPWLAVMVVACFCDAPHSAWWATLLLGGNRHTSYTITPNCTHGSWEHDIQGLS